MDIPKYESEFQFLAHKILEFSVKNSYDKMQDADKISRNINVAIDDLCAEVSGEDIFGVIKVRIIVNINEDDGENSGERFDSNLLIEGGFVAPSSVGEEQFMSMLKTNGFAALYSIARSIYTLFSSLTFVEGRVVLPLVNFNQIISDENIKNS